MVRYKQSLFALRDVISAKRTKQTHIPYRNSILTRYLQDSLEASAKTLMILQLSPSQTDCEETLCSLNFGAKTRETVLPAKKAR